MDWVSEPPHDYYSNSFLRNENIIIRELGPHGYVWLLGYKFEDEL